MSSETSNKTKHLLAKQRRQREKARARRDMETAKMRLTLSLRCKTISPQQPRVALPPRKPILRPMPSIDPVNEEKEAPLPPTNSQVYLDARKSALLIESYVKSLEAMLGLLVPKELNGVLLCYYFQFLPPYKLATNQIATVDEEQQILSTNGTGWLGRLSYVIFATPWNSGIHELRMQCIRDSGKAIGIGMVTNLAADTEHWLFDHSEGGLTYQVYSCKNSDSKPGIFRYREGKEEHVEHIEKPMSDGMVVSLQADFVNNTISYFFDGKQMGTPLSIEGSRTYYPAVAYNCGGKSQPTSNQKGSACAAYRLLLCA